MKLKLPGILGLLCAAVGRGLFAQAVPDPGLSLQGFTGVLNTPSAHVQREGTFDVLYSNQKDDISGYGTPTSEDNFLFSVGMFNFAEVGGRLVNTDPFPAHSAIRDLSVNVKLSTDPLTAHFRFSPALAVGIQDVGGGAHLFGTKYIAGSVDPLGWLTLTAGYGHGPQRMKGGYGGVELRAHKWVTLLGDYDTSKTFAGARVTAPKLPYLPVRLTATFSSPIQHSPQFAIAGGVVIPLDFNKASRRNAVADAEPAHNTLWGALRAHRVSAAVPGTAPATVVAATPTTPAAVIAPPAVIASAPIAPMKIAEPLSLEGLRERLIHDGFVNVRVGTHGPLLVVEYENIRYNHNELDAIGVVAGLASQVAGGELEQLRLVVRRKGLALLQIETQLLPLHDWLDGNPQMQAPSLTVSQEMTGDYGIQFVAGSTNPGRLKPSIMVYPALTTLVGTEHGVFDYQLSIRPELQVPLWRGATAVARADLPVAHSGNLDDGQVYADFRTPAQLDRAMLFQAFTITPGLVANLGVGRILTTNTGMLNELSWTPSNGMNRFKAIQSWGRDSGNNRSVLLGSYRLFLARYDLAFEGVAGRFYGQDKGVLVSMQRFFGDASTSLYIKDTVASGFTNRTLQAGIQVEFPLTRRRDMKARPVQIRGNEDWSYAQETGIASSSTQNANYVESGLAIVPQTTQSLNVYFYDRERLNSDYIMTHTERIREAWRYFRDGV